MWSSVQRLAIFLKKIPPAEKMFNLFLVPVTVKIAYNRNIYIYIEAHWTREKESVTLCDVS